MRKQKLIFTVVIFMFAGNIFAQSGWQRIQDFIPYGFSKVEFTGTDTVFVGGSFFDFIFKSTDKGNTWQKKTYRGLGRYIHDYMKFFDSQNAIINTTDGVIKTTNGGENFNWLYHYNFISSISFINMNTGYIKLSESQNLLKTTDGGNSWNTVYQNFPYYQLYFINENTGFVNDNTFYKTLRTTNGGVNWNVVLIDNTADDLKLIGSDIYLISSNVIFKSTNNGLNFSPFFTASNNLQHISAINLTTFILSTYDSLIYKTTNSGITWTTYTVPYRASVNVGFNSQGYGVSANSNGKIYTIAADLTTVNDIYKDKIQKIDDMAIINEDILYTIGEPNTFAKSTDGGMTFTKNHIEFSLNSFSFLNINTGFATSQNKILKTSNGGTNWNTIFENNTGASYILEKICAVNDQYGYFWKNYNSYVETLYVSTNGSETWTQSNLNKYKIPTGIVTYKQKNILGLKVFPSGIGYCAVTFNIYPDSNRILKTTDFGKNWYNTTGNLNAQSISILKFINKDTGFAVINTNHLYRTLDGGSTWDLSGYIQSTNAYGTNDLTFINANTGFCVYWINGSPESLIIGKTTNAGVSWRETNLNTDYIPIHNIKFVNEQTGFLYGGPSGQIYKTTDGGFVFVKQTSSQIPEQFLLKQNYPNPFNPSTVIRYQLSVAGFTTLKVFDLLGKEVAQLVNEKQSAGSYAVDFNSTEFNLPSGIYFYSLSAGEFKETKKMVLIK
ncbi:MAG: T9SS type A sorting domain-containing protein [Ignavibacteria bacterium]|nr:T9SS type A sorting domain-containing protein [Ignavibacteria bacterium]